MQIFGAILLACAYLVLYTLFGQAFISLFKIKTKSLIFTTIIGFFVYYSVFQICALPLKITLSPLSRLSLVWVIVVIAVSILTIKFSGKELLIKLNNFKNTFLKNKLALIAIFAIVALQLIVIESNWFPGSTWDTSFYIGEITSSVQTNTIEQYDPYTGQILDYLNDSYLLENYEMHSAVVCQLFGIHPLIEVRTVMTCVVLLISNSIFYKIAECFFGEKYYQSAVMMFFIAIINAFNVSMYQPSSFLFNRTYEGKTILGVIIIPMVTYLFIKFVQEESAKHVFTSLFVVNFAAFCLNMSSVYVLSLAMVVFFIPAVLIKKQFKHIKGFLICMLPCVTVAFITYALGNDWIVISI